MTDTPSASFQSRSDASGERQLRSTGPELGHARQPLLKWPGGKRSELPVIRPHIPRHTRYFEPFFGGGSVFFDAIRAQSYANDLHEDLISFYRCVRGSDSEFFGELYRQLDTWETGTVETRAAQYYGCRERYNDGQQSNSHRAADFFLLRELAYGGMFRVNSRGNFNVPFGRAYARNKNLRAKIDYLNSGAVAARLQNISFSATDFEIFLKEFEFGQHDFMFVDPPYDTAFSTYSAQGFDYGDQERLAACLSEFPGKFMLVCKVTPLVQELYYYDSRFRRLEYPCKYKFNIKGRFSRDALHVMVTNYDFNQ